MSVNRSIAKYFDLDKFTKDLENIDNQYLNLIYDENTKQVMERSEYEKVVLLMKWKCAICGSEILSDRTRIDCENFVCDKCKKIYNNKNSIIDRRIMDSRTRMFNIIESSLYDELENNMKGGK